MDRRTFFRAIAAAALAPRAALRTIASWRPLPGVTLTGLSIDYHRARQVPLAQAAADYQEMIVEMCRKVAMERCAVYEQLKRDGLLGPHDPGAL